MHFKVKLTCKIPKGGTNGVWLGRLILATFTKKHISIEFFFNFKQTRFTMPKLESNRNTSRLFFRNMGWIGWIAGIHHYQRYLMHKKGKKQDFE